MFTIAQSPVIGGYNVYYGILHNHTNVSDGTGTQDEAYHYARYTAGLDFFSTADHHNYIVESEWAEIRAASDKYNEDGVFTAFWGFEWTGSSHVTVTNTEDYPGISPDPAGTLEQLYGWLDARNGVAFFNHPNRGEGKSFEGFVSRPCSKVVGMELYNSTDDFSMHYYNDGYWPDDGGLSHFDEALTRGWRIGAAGSDDNHARYLGHPDRLQDGHSFGTSYTGRTCLKPCGPGGFTPPWIRTLPSPLKWTAVKWVQSWQGNHMIYIFWPRMVTESPLPGS